MMKQEVERLKQKVEAAVEQAQLNGDELGQNASGAMIKTLRLFRLRFHEPVYLSLYPALIYLGQRLEVLYPQSGPIFNEMIRETGRNEEQLFKKVYPSFEIDLQEPPSSEEIQLIESLRMGLEGKKGEKEVDQEIATLLFG